MTRVVCTVKNGKFSLIRIEGHAAFAQKGFDIVCAGISSIVEGTQSFFKTKYYRQITVKRDQLGTTFSIIDYNNEFLQTCLQMFVHQLRNISYFYPDYIVIFFA